MLDRQAEEDWLTPENIDYKLSQQINQILPPTILSHVDYYKKLNDYALLMEQGHTKEAEDIKLNKNIIHYKNKQLQPIYEELKTIIRHFTYTEENSIHALYQETMMRIDNYLVTNNNKEDFKLLKDNLNYLFKKLVHLLMQENEKPDNKLQIIEHQLKHLTMVLVLWNKYTEIIYTSDAEIEKILALKRNEDEQDKAETTVKDLDQLADEKDPKILKQYYFNKITEKKSKGSGIFIQDFRGLYDDVAIRKTVEVKSQSPQELKKLSDLPNTKETYTTESDEDFEASKEVTENSEEKTIDNKGKKLLAGTKSTTKRSSVNKIKERKSITGEKRKLLESEVSEVFEEEEVEVEPRKDTSDINDTFEPSTSSTQKNAIKKIKKDRKLLEEFMLMQIKNQTASSKVSELNVAKEYNTYKEILVKELGLKDEKELFADIDKELDEIDLSSR